MAVPLSDLTRPGGLFPLTRLLVGGDYVEVYDRGPRTLRDVFLDSRSFGPRIAIRYQEESWSFDAQWNIVLRLAASMSERFRVVAGDRVAIAARNFPEWTFAFWATQLLGAVAVPINAWMTGEELAQVIDHAEPRLIFADEERLDRLGACRERVGNVIGLRAAPRAGVVHFQDAMAATAQVDLPPCAIGPDDIATIIYTSGTTARPKGVVATHRNHAASLLNRYIRVVAGVIPAGGAIVEPRREEQPEKVKLMAYPLFHIAGVGTMSACMFSGFTMTLMYKWDVAEAIRVIKAQGVSELSGPPLVVQQTVDAARRDCEILPTLTLLGCGGASAPTRMLSNISEVFDGRVTPTTGYGMTETTGGATAINGADFVAHPDAVGRALPTMQVKIMDEDGTEPPHGTPGEIAIRGPQVMREYYKDPDATAQALQGGWFRSGDLGTMDETGLVRIVGRLKDIVIRGGENISCSEVEMCIANHPLVEEVAAVGVPHPMLGEELGAVVRLYANAEVPVSELRAFAAGRLAGFKVPAHILVTTEPLPRTATGKIVKRQMSPFIEQILRAAAIPETGVSS